MALLTSVKPIWTSTTVQGIVVTGLGILLNKYGYQISQSDLVNWVGTLGEIIGLGLALWGRIKATQKLR